ncbi:helicase-associated domain-containing protein [Blastococcus sp. BMG 814]|uniref:Helicase-associated domain-containing protein n=1 Tax=Blastococcus carthaginiensis TaxID=3050034 RepID=A0ABT9IHR4_9ACTN|nr:helicase-associated domain-containing protein [Blastococcus carthaginiensis]MDP5185119.1 helicase-associated domain-containing protein [Blastococcus carthaginiensis]
MNEGLAGAGATEGPAVRNTEPEALANLAAVLRLCQAGRLQCSAKTSRPSAATVRAVAGVLVAGDFYPDDAIAAFAWPLLLQAGGLARLNGSRLALTPKGRRALGQPAHEVIRDIWQRWPRHAPIDELSRVEQIKGQKAAAVLSAAGPRREAATAAIRHCPPGEWAGVDGLFTTLRRHEHRLTVARSERALWKLYIVDPEYGSLGYDGYHDFRVLEGRYVLAVLFEYAATLGLIDVEYVAPAQARDDFRHMWGADWLDALSRYDGLGAVRLTALGAYACGLASEYAPPAPPVAERALEVLPNLDVVVLGDLPAADRLLLDAFATRGSDRVWTLSAPSLLAAADAGHPPRELAGFLADRAVHGVPPVVQTLMDDVEARLQRVRDLGLHRVVECADVQTATLLAADRTLRGLCTRIGDRHLLIEPTGEAKARAALLRLGHPLGPPS